MAKKPSASASPKTDGEILRQPAEVKYADELAYLASVDTAPRPFMGACRREWCGCSSSARVQRTNWIAKSSRNSTAIPVLSSGPSSRWPPIAVCC